MDAGRIVQQASPAVLYDRPLTPWVARFVGDANLVGGAAHGTSAVTSVGAIALREPAAGDVQLLLRPEELRLDAVGSSDTAGPAAVVELVEYYGHDCVTFARLADGEVVRVRSGSAPRFTRGDPVLVRYAGPPAVAFSAGDAPGFDEGWPPPGGTGARAGDPAVATSDGPRDGTEHLVR
jgi:ABC-type Fe3+/spermidine/putrescine transport system ATPase subunit